VQGYTRRQLKEDKLVSTAQGAAQWTQSHQRTVLWSIVAGVLIILAVVGFMAWQGRYNEQANVALGGAMRTFERPLLPPGAPAPKDPNVGFTSLAERGKAAAKDFQAVADKFPWSRPGKIARYMESVATMQAGDNAAAEQQLKAVAGGRDKDIASLAQMTLARLYRSTNRQSDATRLLKELADHPTNLVSKAEAQLELASIYETTDPQQAANIYQQIQKENPQGAAAQIAASKLSGGKPGANPNF
jgi:predicted negative regulator of RcsB-dependent stress response